MRVNNDANDDASDYVGNYVDVSDGANNHVDVNDDAGNEWRCAWQTHDNLSISVFEIHPKYYVDLPINFTTINQETIIDTTNVIVNIDEVTP